MNIFIVGYSQCGKTTFATQFRNFKHVSAGGWTIRFGFDKTDSAYRKKVTEASTAALKENPDECINYIQEAFKTPGNYVVEGMRNPRDFLKVFNPTIDVVIFLKPQDVNISNQFDMGVDIIQNCVAWMTNCGMISKAQVMVEDCHNLNETIKLYNDYYTSF